MLKNIKAFETLIDAFSYALEQCSQDVDLSSWEEAMQLPCLRDAAYQCERETGVLFSISEKGAALNLAIEKVCKQPVCDRRYLVVENDDWVIGVWRSDHFECVVSGRRLDGYYWKALPSVPSSSSLLKRGETKTMHLEPNLVCAV